MIIPTNVAKAGIDATGGTITEAGGYRIHTFTTSGTFTLASTTDTLFEYLVVAGGGSGGGGTSNPGVAGGGGAGGLRTGFAQLTPQAYTITVGNGGTNGGGSSQNNGGDSSLASLVVCKGGGCGGYYSAQTPGTGGSGGGGAQHGGSGVSGTQGQGYAGGNALNYGGGGGGGAGGVGSNGWGSNPWPEGGNGGPGVQSSISGTAQWYAGGGGGSSHGSATQGRSLGGSGVGGRGHYGSGVPGSDGAANTGSGGGGGGENTAAGNGAAGIVIIRYPIADVAAPTMAKYSVSFAGTNTDYVSFGSNAAFAPGTGDFSLEGWIYPTSWGSAWSLIHVAQNYGLYVGSIGGAFAIRSAGVGNVLEVALPSLNTWTHVAACRTGTTLSLFFNGSRVGSMTSSYNFSGTGPATTGNYSGAVTYGLVSNMRFVVGRSVYDATSSSFTAPTNPLPIVANTSLLTYNSAVIADNSGNNFAATLNGPPTVSSTTPFS